MKPTCAIVLAAILALATCGANAQEETMPHYRVKARLEPASNRLEAEVTIQHPPSSRFYLHWGLAVQQVRADGKEMAFRVDDSAPRLQHSVGIPILVEAGGV